MGQLTPVWPPSLRVALISGHAALLVVHLAPANAAPRPLPGLISDSNAAIIHALTGARNGIVQADNVFPDTGCPFSITSL